MEKLEIMPQYVYKFTLPDELLNKSLEYSTQLDYSKENQKILDFKELPELTSFIEKSLEEIRLAEDIRFEYIKPHLMWINKKAPGAYAPRHVHPNSLFSGIIYLTTSDCRTWFSIPNMWNPNASREYPSPFRYNSNVNPEIIHKQPSIAGTMLVFPSELPHSVDNNKSPMVRYTIAFNAFPCGKSLTENGSLSHLSIEILESKQHHDH